MQKFCITQKYFCTLGKPFTRTIYSVGLQVDIPVVGTWAESFQTPLKTIIAGVSQNAVSNDTYFEMLELAQFKGISIS